MSQLKNKWVIPLYKQMGLIIKLQAFELYFSGKNCKFKINSFFKSLFRRWRSRIHLSTWKQNLHKQYSGWIVVWVATLLDFMSTWGHTKNPSLASFNSFLTKSAVRRNLSWKVDQINYSNSTILRHKIE